MIGTFGASVTYRNIVRGDYDAGTGTSSTTQVDYPLKGIIERVREALIGTEVKAGDWRIDIAALALPVVPNTNDVLVVGSGLLRIVRVHPVYSGDEVAVYEVYGRR